MASKLWQTVQTKYRSMVAKHPMSNAMLAYGTLWPTACCVQQTFEGKNFKTYNYGSFVRFALYGGFIMAPSLYCWIRLTTAMWPEISLRATIYKAALDQVTFTPLTFACFYFGMSLLEFKTVPEAIEEVRKKMAPTYRLGLCFWPFVQTINYSVIPPHNRLIFASICSFAWTTLLSYVKNNKSIKASSVETKLTNFVFSKKTFD